MPLKPIRRFAISDAMVLIAAAAVGTAALRATAPNVALLRRELGDAPSQGIRIYLLHSYALKVAVPFLAAWTSALLFLRLRQPRPRLRRVFQQPGTIACVVATLAMTIEAIWVLALPAVHSRIMYFAENIFIAYAEHVSFAVVGGWSALALSGHWRSEPNWIDRAGRITGVVWLAVTAVRWCSFVLIG